MKVKNAGQRDNWEYVKNHYKSDTEKEIMDKTGLSRSRVRQLTQEARVNACSRSILLSFISPDNLTFALNQGGKSFQDIADDLVKYGFVENMSRN